MISKRKTILSVAVFLVSIAGFFAFQYVRGVSITSLINMNSRSITNLSTLGGDSEAINGSYLRSSLQPIYTQLGSALPTSQDYGRSGVASTLYEGTTALSDKYLDKTAKAADTDKLDGNDSPDFQRRVSGTCSSGSAISKIDSYGAVTCETDDIGMSESQDYGRSGVATDLYEGSQTLSNLYLGKYAKAANTYNLDGYDYNHYLRTTAKAADTDKLDGYDSTDFQKRVSGSCVGGLAITQVYSDGTVSCKSFLWSGIDCGRYAIPGCDPLYEGTTALPNKYLDRYYGKAADTDRLDGYHASDLQARVWGNCSSGYAIRKIYSDGSVDCQKATAFWRRDPLASNDTYYPGNVAIGKSQANYPLDIEGTLSVSGTKNFVIDHPTKENTKLIHSTLEGPEAAVFYRGEGQLQNGQAVIELPDYFEALTRKENRTVLLTPKSETENEAVSYLAASAVENGRFKVKAADANNLSQKFFWEVKAVRADVEPLEVEIPK